MDQNYFLIDSREDVAIHGRVINFMRKVGDFQVRSAAYPDRTETYATYAEAENIANNIRLLQRKKEEHKKQEFFKAKKKRHDNAKPAATNPVGRKEPRVDNKP